MENLREALRKLEQIVQVLNANPSRKINKKYLNVISNQVYIIFCNFIPLNECLNNADRPRFVRMLYELLYANIYDRFDKDDFISVVDKLQSLVFLLEKQPRPVAANTLQPKLPISIQGLTIVNYSNIKSSKLTIPSNTSFVVLTGNNAEGKTSLLQAIAESAHFETFVGLFKFGAFLLMNINVEGKIRSRFMWDNYAGLISDNEFDLLETHLVAYGASRLQLQSSESQDVQHLKKSNIYNLFHAESPLLNIEYWFKIQKLKQEETRIQAVKTLLMSLMPTIQDIQMGVKKTQLSDYAITYIENGKELLSKQLSAGNKSILAMIGDMLIRLYDAQPNVIEPSQLSGIVLIDEFELHLHPSWQKKLPQLLVKHFPLVQFIVSTHSPIVFLGMPPDAVLFNISKDEMGETLIQRINIDLANVLPNQILTSALFGIDDIRNIHNQSLQELSVETEPEIKKRKAAEEQLKKVSQNFTFKLPSNDKN